MTVPRFMLAGESDSVPAVAPVPLSATFTVGFEAFEVIDRVEVMAPAVAGANVTDRFTLEPAARVYGKVMPLRLKPDPVTLAAETLTLEPPVLDTVSVCVWLLPTVTFPRFMLLGVAVRVPGVIPLPLRGTFTVGLDAFELMASVEL